MGSTHSARGQINKNRNCCCEEFCKCVFVFYNLIFLLCGCLICGQGIWTITEKWCFLALTMVDTYMLLAWLLACTGMVSAMTALLGYSAVVCQSRCLLGLVRTGYHEILAVHVCVLLTVHGSDHGDLHGGVCHGPALLCLSGFS